MRLCGEFRAEHIDQVKAELTSGGTRVALDLDEGDLLDVECVRFLKASFREGSLWKLEPLEQEISHKRSQNGH